MIMVVDMLLYLRREKRIFVVVGSNVGGGLGEKVLPVRSSSSERIVNESLRTPPKTAAERRRRE